MGFSKKKKKKLKLMGFEKLPYTGPHVRWFRHKRMILRKSLVYKCQHNQVKDEKKSHVIYIHGSSLENEIITNFLFFFFGTPIELVILLEKAVGYIY